MASVGDAVTHDVRGVALGIATLLFLVGGSIGSAAVAGLGHLVGVPGSLAILAIFPLAGIAVLTPELRRVPEAVGASR
jgi:homoserine acetyltransferase